MPKHADKIDFRQLSLRHAADALNVTDRTLHRWVAEKCPRNENGSFDLAKISEWLISRATGAGGMQLEAQRARLAGAQAERAELDLAERKGELMNCEDAAREWGGLVLAARNRMRGLPTTLAPVFAGMDNAEVIAARMIAEIDAALLELSEVNSDSKGDEGTGGASVRPAAAADGKRVGRHKAAA